MVCLSEDTTLLVLDGRNILLAISHFGCSNWMCPVKPATFEHCKRRYGSLNPEVLGSAGENNPNLLAPDNRRKNIGFHSRVASFLPRDKIATFE